MFENFAIYELAFFGYIMHKEFVYYRFCSEILLLLAKIDEILDVTVKWEVPTKKNYEYYQCVRDDIIDDILPIQSETFLLLHFKRMLHFLAVM